MAARPFAHGYAAMAVTLLVVAMLGSCIPVASAQTGCTRVWGAGCNVQDATAAVQALRANPNRCCRRGYQSTIMLTRGSCALTITGGAATTDGGWCLPCALAGNYLWTVLQQCSVNGRVQGYYGVERSQKILYMTSTTVRP